MLNVTAIAEEYRRHREGLLAEFPELADDPRALADTLEGVTSATDAVSKCVRSAMDTDALAEALAARIRDMGERRTRLQARADRLRAVALAVMNAVEMPRLETAEFTASVGHSQPAVQILDEALLPDGFIRLKREPDKKAIRQAIAGGADVPGAALGNGHPTLTVRTR